MDQTLSIDEATARHYLTAYLREAPVATALWRSIEAAALSTIDLPHPILDIGCGFGEFARLFFQDREQPEVGVDIDRGELSRAAAVSPAIYGSILQCDARRLPFEDGSFNSVISVSTLEHIPDVEATIREAARVLRPSGAFAFTVPIAPFNRNLLGHRILRVGSRSLADSYANAVHRRLTHVNIWPAVQWAEAVGAAGLAVERQAATVSPTATMAFESLLPAAFANRLFRMATGRRPPHPGAFVRATERVMRGMVMKQSPNGSNLFIVARKPAH